MNTHMNTKRILIFLAFAFGIPWAAALVVYLSGWFDQNPLPAQGMANTIFISTPWLASLATRLITKEGWGNLGLRPNFKLGWRFYLAAWLLPFAVTAVGATLFYLFFPQSFDSNLVAIQKLVAGTPAETTSPWLLFGVIAMQMVLITVLINTVASMGEELGWRGYLLPKLVERFHGSDGSRRAALLTGLIHGVWHWPLILMSMSILPGVTFLTPLVYLVFICSLSILLSWVALRSGSVWPAAMGHGANNAAAALPGFLLKGSPIPLVGPDPTGLVGGFGYILLALVLFFNRKAYSEQKKMQPESDWAVAGVEKV